MPGEWIWIAAALAAPSGFRGDGTGVVAEGTIPSTWEPTWRVALPAWSNASPVVAGDLVCVLVEPVTVRCVDRATGTGGWTAAQSVLSALPKDERAKLGPELEALAAAADELPELQRAHNKLRRVVRGGGSDQDEEALEALSARILDIQQRMRSRADYLTPPDQEMIGWSTPTPATDGTDLVVLTGNGVIARYAPDGTTRWSRWLGPPPRPMHGYPLGTSASPIWRDDVIVVPYGELRGLDAATGATRWSAGPYRDFGTPVVVEVDGGVIATPAGRVVRLSDGAVRAENLGAVFWSSPTAAGSTVVYAGGTGDAHTKPTRTEVWAVDLTAADGTLRASRRWTSPLEVEARVYASPVVVDGQVVVVTDRGEVARLGLQDGAVRQTFELPSYGFGHVPSPVAVGHQVLVGAERVPWDLLVWDGATLAPDAAPTTPTGTRATPQVADGVLYLRTFGALTAVPLR